MYTVACEVRPMPLLLLLQLGVALIWLPVGAFMRVRVSFNARVYAVMWAVRPMPLLLLLQLGVALIGIPVGAFMRCV